MVITRGERPRQRLNRFSPVPETILIRTIAARSRAMLRAGLNIYAIVPLKNTDSDFDELTSVSAGPGHGLQFMPKYRSTTGEGRGSLSAAALDPTAFMEVQWSFSLDSGFTPFVRLVVVKSNASD